VKALVLTRHAQAKMRERAILRSWVEQTARNPQWTEPEPLDPTVERRFGVSQNSVIAHCAWSASRRMQQFAL
jgi:hypothetical protein